MSDRHPIVQAWINGENDAGGCIAELERALSKGNAALDRVAEKLRKAGAMLPAPDPQGTPESGINTGLCIALALVEQERETPCERCGGKGLVTLFGVPNGIGFEMDADDQPCPECKS